MTGAGSVAVGMGVKVGMRVGVRVGPADGVAVGKTGKVADWVSAQAESIARMKRQTNARKISFVTKILTAFLYHGK